MSQQLLIDSHIRRFNSWPEQGTRAQKFLAGQAPCNAASSSEPKETRALGGVRSMAPPLQTNISYNLYPTGMATQETPVDPQELVTDDSSTRLGRARHRIGHLIETKTAHIIILVLTLLDILVVLLQIGASLLHLDETKEELWFIALFGHLSLAIVSVFMLEISLKTFAFGPRYFWRGTKHGVLHLIDAFIILTSFFLEIFLHGVAEELTSLLILFRLWRVIKLAGTVALEVSEHDEAQCNALEAKVQCLEKELEESRLKIQKLEGFNG